jgi:hypothetical protein
MFVTRPTLPRLSVLGGCFALALLTMGCGSGGGAPGVSRSVSGTVTFKDKPLPGGEVTFFGGKDGKEASSAGLIDEEGKYTLTNPPVGDVKIVVHGPTPSSDASKPKKPVEIPKHYSDRNQSGLSYKVTEEAKQTHNIELKP